MKLPVNELEHDENVDKDENDGREQNRVLERRTQLFAAEHERHERLFVRVDYNNQRVARKPLLKFDIFRI